MVIRIASAAVAIVAAWLLERLEKDGVIAAVGTMYGSSAITRLVSSLLIVLMLFRCSLAFPEHWISDHWHWIVIPFWLYEFDHFLRIWNVYRELIAVSKGKIADLRLRIAARLKVDSTASSVEGCVQFGIFHMVFGSFAAAAVLFGPYLGQMSIQVDIGNCLLMAAAAAVGGVSQFLLASGAICLGHPTLSRLIASSLR